MNTIRARIVASHILAAVGSVIGLGFAWLVFNPVVVYLVSGEWPEAIIDGPNLFCMCSWIWLPLCILPLSVAADLLLVRKLHWRARWHLPIMALVYFLPAFSLGSVTTLLLLGSSGWDRTALVGLGSAVLLLAVDFTLWGLTYWALLRAADWFFGRGARGISKSV